LTQSPDIPEKELREKCRALLSKGAEEARKLGHNYIGTEHIFIATTRDENSPTSQLLKRAALNPREVRQAIRREIGMSDDVLADVLPLTPRTVMVLSLAIFLAESGKESDSISEQHFLMALLQEGEGVPVRKLIDLGFDTDKWLKLLISEQDLGILAPVEENFGDSILMDIEDDSDNWVDSSDEFIGDNFDSDMFNFRASPLSRFGNSPNNTPLLDRYGRDLTEQAKAGKIAAAIAREREIRALARTLARSKKNNPLLLGDAGVGKTAIVEGLAHAITKGTAPKPLLDKRIIQIEIGTLVAGTSLRGQFEERLIGIVEETNRAGNVILFIDEIHTIVGAGDTIDSNLDAANILKPALARGEIKCIGATTHEEYRRAIAADPALARRFRTIDVEEPSEADAITILMNQRERLEAHHAVTILPATVETAVQLSIRYMTDKRLPDKALDLLDEACTRVTIRTVHPDDLNAASTDVTPADVVAVLAEWTGIPITELTADEKRRLATLESALKARVLGQERAVRVVADTVKTARAGLNDPNRPVGVFLFLGPSGVGKTELARALAAFLFGNEDAMLRLDMSEFHDAHTVARLIGAPPGYKEANKGGQLTDGLRRRPYCVVLLDEVEKAAPEVFDLFLQIFDEGRLSDAQGRHVDARHAVFIMTSNIGTRENAKSLGFGGVGADGDDAELDYTPHLKQFFRPEFLNRVDEIVTFRPLNRATMSQILDLQLRDLRLRLEKQGIRLELTPEAQDVVLKQGYDPINGARPLKRAVERLLTRPLSHWLLSETFQKGAVVRAVPQADADALTFESVEVT
jgi:ATP-dependent Clp protease ATP-binding subunit ClpC